MRKQASANEQPWELRRDAPRFPRGPAPVASAPTADRGHGALGVARASPRWPTEAPLLPSLTGPARRDKGTARSLRDRRP